MRMRDEGEDALASADEKAEDIGVASLDIGVGDRDDGMALVAANPGRLTTSCRTCVANRSGTESLSARTGEAVRDAPSLLSIVGCVLRCDWKTCKSNAR